jgi:hypothetical protein
MTFSDNFGFRPKTLGLIVVGFVLLYLAYTSIRKLRVDALGRAAMTVSDPSLVDKLASYGGESSADLLLVVAGGPAPLPNRISAIHALVSRKDVALVSRLSALLVPPEPLEVRQAIAQALYLTGCSPECVKNVLYYQERISEGARPAEEMQAEPPHSLSKTEQDLLAVLDQVLRKNKAALEIVLGQVYGLTTYFPSSFAIQTVERLEVKSACPALIHTLLSQNEQVHNSPEYQEVAQAVKILRCVADTPPPPQ